MSFTSFDPTKTFRLPTSPPPSPQGREKKFDEPISVPEANVNTSVTRSTKWADGLRGISAVFVLSSHLVLCFDRSLVLPSLSEDGPTKLFQRPIFRLIAQGPAWVAIFFILLGYVNSLKVIKLSRQGKIDEALQSLAVSSFRRTWRLVFPAATVTLIAWFATQIGVFSLARRTDAYWLSVNSPAPSASWSQAISDLFKELVGMWIWAENRYDQPQWALFHLFKGSMYVFMFLLATVRVRPRMRVTASIGLWVWSWAAGDALIGPNIWIGVLLAELTYMDFNSFPFSVINNEVGNILPYLFAPVGLFFMSYPSSYAHQARWSYELQDLGIIMFPAVGYDERGLPYLTSSIDLGRAWPALGAQILCACILFSPSLRRVFETRSMCWLGGVSMAMYLLHGPLMRSILAYLVFGPKVLFDWRERNKLSSSTTAKAAEKKWIGSKSIELGSSDNNQGPAGAPPTPPLPAMEPKLLQLPANLWILISIAIFFVILLLTVTLWNKKVEPLFAQATAAVEKMCLPEQTRQNKSLGPGLREEEKRWLGKKREDDESSSSGSSGDEMKRGLGRISRDRRGTSGTFLLPAPVTAN